MSRRLYLLLVTLLASGLIAVGCGDDDDDDGGGSDEPAQTQEDTGGDTEDTDTGGGTSDVPENVAAAVQQCKDAVDGSPQLSADLKSDLKSICEDAGEGDEDAVREATKEVCVKIIEDQVPAGEARDTAVQACEEAGETP